MFDARAFYIASGRSTNNHSEDIYPTAGIFRAARKYWNALKDTTCGKPIPVFNITQYNRYCGIHYVSPSPDAYPDEDTPSARTDLSRVDAELADGIRCLQQDVARAGGQAIVTSAYRSPAYQSHLRSVWDQFDSIQMRYRYPECTVETTKIRREFRNHGLLTTQRPASASGPHTLGNAVDVAVSLPPESNIDEIAENCGVYRRLPVNDPVHFELIRNENED